MNTIRAILILSFAIFIRAKAFSRLRNPFELEVMHSKNYHTVDDCMYVTSEAGYHSYSKKYSDPEAATCGIYIVTDPDKLIQVNISSSHLNCKAGALMSFVDGWELNHEYYPSIRDHHIPLDQRVTEFCDGETNNGRIFRSTQNAALIQYKNTFPGSFIVTISFIKNPMPCHIMVEGISPSYTLENFGLPGNCTLTALFPAVVSVMSMSIGEHIHDVSYDCYEPRLNDKLYIGGVSGLDTYDMESTTLACGNSGPSFIANPPEQAIFCGTTSVRLESSGAYANRVIVSMRQATEDDLSIATLICN